MLISTNEAAEILRFSGLNRDRARLLLRSGVAGPGIRTRGALLYDEERVRAVERRRFLTQVEVAAACPHGILVGRLSRNRTFDATAPAEHQRRAVSGPWRIDRTPFLRLTIGAHRETTMPFVATVCGFIVVGADVIGQEPHTDGAGRLRLAPPGDWFDAMRDRRWLPGRGGAPLLLWGWEPFRPMPS